MRIRTVATISAVVMLAGVPAASAGAAAPVVQSLSSAGPTGPTAVPGEIVVGFRVGVDGSERAEARSAAEVRARRDLLARGAQLVKVERGQTVPEAIAALEKRADVRFAEPNWIYEASATTPDDPRFGGLWGLNNTGQTINGRAGTADDDIDAPEAWDVNRGSASTVVAVVDSGVAYEHPDLAPNMWSNADEIAGNGSDDDENGKVDDVRGWDFVGSDNDPWDYEDHGTHVAGTIAARGNNGMGVAGVAWQASIMPVRALNASGAGSNANIADAFIYAATNGATVVNASLGGPVFSQAMSDAITGHPDTLFVVAAGNAAQNNDTTPSYPCNYTAANLICVAATNNTDTLAGFSNYGATSVDLAAPGVDIDSARPHYLPDTFSDDFESGLDNWTVQSGPWGTTTALNTTWLVDSPGANYANNADWAIRTTAKVDLGDRTDCVLKFRSGTFLQAGFDWLAVQSSADGTAWTDLATIGDTNGTVRSVGLVLGAAGSRYYRFRLTSNGSVVRNGVYIDNVRVACRGGTYTDADYRSVSGTSMASPHVAGAAAVLFSAKPSATVAEVKEALVDTGDPVDGLSSMTVSGRRLNLDAALRSPAMRADTTTVIGSHDPEPSVVGQAVTVHYSVTGEGLDSGAPTGNVTVSDGTESCTGTVAAGQCTLVFTTAGPRSLTASYAGDDAYYNPSPASSSVSHVVERADTTTTITADGADPTTVGDAVTVEFTVAALQPGAGTPTGDVTVSDGVASCTATVAAGECDISLTTRGTKSLIATYAGDSNFNSSTSAGEPHTVSGLATITTLRSAGPDPSVAGQPVTVHYEVAPSAPGAGTPTGNVTVSDGVDSCTAAVAAGRCDITLTTVGTRTLTAGYAGDSIFEGSTSGGEAHTVNPPITAPPAVNPPPTVNPPSPPPLARIFDASQTHRKFRVSAKPWLARISRRRTPVGTTFKYNLDRAATVRFDFTQPRRGRTVSGRCVAPNGRNRRAPKCNLLRGSLTFAGHAGLNTVRFKGWLSRTNKLARGRYTLVMTAITPGVGVTSQQLKFTIAR